MLSETSSLQLKIALSEKERQEVFSLLTQQKLPVTDIKEDTLLYLLLNVPCSAV